MDILSAFKHLLGGGKPRTVTMTSKGKATQHAPLSDEQQAQANAQIAADGANTYNAAHPGKPYVMGQNGETYDGGVDAALYARLLHQTQAPQPLQPMRQTLLNGRTLQAQPMNPQMASGMPGDIQIAQPVQGMTNPGLIPLQSGRRPLNPQSRTLYYSGDY